jgi:hypothetical protein
MRSPVLISVCTGQRAQEIYEVVSAVYAEYGAERLDELGCGSPIYGRDERQLTRSAVIGRSRC